MGLARLLLAPSALIIAVRAGHYAQPPCGFDEVQGEVQGATGYICAPRCKDNTYECATDSPVGTSAQAQCMLQDVDRGSFCGLLCQVDSQCPTGARCRQLKQVEVGLCMYPASFTDWAKQVSTRKLMVGWPTKSADTSGIAKTYAALQSLKSKYSIDDGDTDMLTLKELLSALSQGGGAGGSAVAGASPGQLSAPNAALSQGQAAKSDNSGGWWPWSNSGVGHDINQFADYASQGLPGFEREAHDILRNIEHANERGKCTDMLRCILLIIMAYLFIGSAVKYQTHGSRGIDMIPHIGFWMEYPRLVNDGMIYAKLLGGDAMGQPRSQADYPSCNL